MPRPAIPCIFAVQFVAYILDPSIQIAVPAKQLSMISILSISSSKRVHWSLNGYNRHLLQPNICNKKRRMLHIQNTQKNIFTGLKVLIALDIF